MPVIVLFEFFWTVNFLEDNRERLQHIHLIPKSLAAPANSLTLIDYLEVGWSKTGITGKNAALYMDWLILSAALRCIFQCLQSIAPQVHVKAMKLPFPSQRRPWFRIEFLMADQYTMAWWPSHRFLPF